MPPPPGAAVGCGDFLSRAWALLNQVEAVAILDVFRLAPLSCAAVCGPQA